MHLGKKCTPYFDEECSSCLKGYELLDIDQIIYPFNISTIGNLKNRCFGHNQPPPGFYYDDFNKMFKKCPLNCYRCTNASTCQVCRHPTDLTINFYVN